MTDFRGRVWPWTSGRFKLVAFVWILWNIQILFYQIIYLRFMVNFPHLNPISVFGVSELNDQSRKIDPNRMNMNFRLFDHFS